MSVREGHKEEGKREEESSERGREREREREERERTYVIPSVLQIM